MRHEVALFNPEVAPLRFAGALISLFAGTRDGAVFNLALRRASQAEHARCACRDGARFALP